MTTQLTQTSRISRSAKRAIANEPDQSAFLHLPSDPLWHNPFAPSQPASTWLQRSAALVDYGVWLAGRPDLIGARNQLHGSVLTCSCGHDQPCHRDVLADLADPDVIDGGQYGRAWGLTVRRPWASLLLVPRELGGKNVENRSWTTAYRGPVLIIAGTRVDEPGLVAARRARLDVNWHTRQQGWLGGAVLTDVHPATDDCCRPWGTAPIDDTPLYHWVFEHPARLALPARGAGFLGLRRTAWTNLIRRDAFAER
ncbi:Uncharacterised protein [Mycobacteroides abscessus subsp. abscessus]|uniref:DUF4326 domain-containing protein n=1 Tax=Mycobacteriaceae TaxID=1762 RepID=UPI0006B393F6|nr:MULTISPECIES: DUF4326 domain-containing protein [Mycobacteriaceae]KAB7754409.1 hypothetical protein MMUC44124_21745 [Mycolicibacterium mucogenicum DSM 44124]SLE97378.1 Uncharacterised protein [Mycobacteroides abscessus subsp. abscessus]